MFKVCTSIPRSIFLLQIVISAALSRAPHVTKRTPRLHALLTVKIYLSSTLHFLEHELASHCRALNSQTELPGDNTTLKQRSFLFI